MLYLIHIVIVHVYHSLLMMLLHYAIIISHHNCQISISLIRLGS